MDKRNLRVLGFAILAAAQLAVPAWMIIGRERTLREGHLFKFRTQPVDPADAFRGRYVWLSLEPDTVKVTDVRGWRGDGKAFAVLDADTDGFAIVKRLDRDRPADEPALPVRAMLRPGVKAGEAHIEWIGLDRYYMTEEKAPAAEAAYWRHNRGTNHACHVTVRVHGTHAVIENLFIENQPIRAWLREHAEN